MADHVDHLKLQLYIQQNMPTQKQNHNIMFPMTQHYGYGWTKQHVWDGGTTLIYIYLNNILKLNHMTGVSFISSYSWHFHDNFSRT